VRDSTLSSEANGFCMGSEKSGGCVGVDTVLPN